MQTFSSLSLGSNPNTSDSIRAFNPLCQWLSNFNIHQNHLEGLLKDTARPYLQSLLFSGFGGEPENWHFYHVLWWCWHCWSWDHTLRTLCDTKLEMLLLVMWWFNIEMGLVPLSFGWHCPCPLSVPSLPFIPPLCWADTALLCVCIDAFTPQELCSVHMNSNTK